MREALVLCFAVMLAAPLAARGESPSGWTGRLDYRDGPQDAQPVPEPQDPEELTIQAFLEAVQSAASTMDRARWIDLLSVNADRERALEFFDVMVPQGITRVVVKERDRSA